MKTRKCCVKGCTSVKRNPKVSFFNAPKANHLAWNLAVSNANCEKTVVKRVCAEHFRPDDIINTYSVPQDVANVSVTLLSTYLYLFNFDELFNYFML